MYPEEVQASNFANWHDKAANGAENAPEGRVDASTLWALRTRMVEGEAAMLAARLRNADLAVHSQKLAA